MIPKKLHFVWVGDESLRPDNCIDTWRERHPDWEIVVWGNRELESHPWKNRRHMEAMAEKELCGVADMMRWEILYAEGGIALDADSVCVRGLDDWLLDHDVFACWESEIARPGLIASGYVGAVPQDPFVGQLVLDLHDKETVVDDRAWKTTGPLHITQCFQKYRYPKLTIFPSHFFIPRHFSGVEYQGSGLVYATQLWGSTTGIYQDLHAKKIRIV